MPDFRGICGFQPSCDKRVVSKSLRGVPSGLVVSHSIWPE